MAILVNDQLVDDQLIREHARLLRDRLRQEMPFVGQADDLTIELEAREWARENVIMRVLLQQAAGTNSADELINQAMANRCPSKAERNYSSLQTVSRVVSIPEMVRAAHIVKNVDSTTNEKEAEAAIVGVERQLKSGADFAMLADLYSDCPGEGGDLGFFAQGDMVPEFESVVFSLRPGEISGVFRSPFGFRIVKLAVRRKAGIAPLREVRNQIEQELWSQNKQQAASHFLQKLRSQAKIRKI